MGYTEFVQDGREGLQKAEHRICRYDSCNGKVGEEVYLGEGC